MTEIIYIFTNEGMPGLIKIGRTSDSVQARLDELSRCTGVPFPFECPFAAEVEDAILSERILHQLFSEHRVNPRREFFRLEPERVRLALSLGKFREVTPDQLVADPQDRQALARAKERRPKIRLDLLGIKKGDMLVFSRDESLVAIIQDPSRNEIVFEGQVMSISKAALYILQNLGYRTPRASGSEYWMFEGELLDERRTRLEEDKFAEDI